MKSSEIAGLLVGLCGLFVQACSSLTGNRGVTGTMELVAYNGKVLPADAGALPPIGPDGTPSNCRIVVPVGTLTLGGGGDFNVRWENHNSCDGRTLSTSGQSGTFTQIGDSLDLKPGGDPAGLKLYAKVFSDRIVVHYPDVVLDFKR